MVNSAKTTKSATKILSQLIKEWTLPVAMGAGTLLYLLFATVPALDGFAQRADHVLETVFPAFMGAVLYTTFCKVRFRRLRPAAWSWPAHFAGLGFVLVIAAAAWFVRSHAGGGVGSVLCESLLACVIAPTATAAAVVTAKLGGNLEHITTHTCVSNVLTALYVPLLFPLVASNTAGSPPFILAFAEMLWKVCLVLVVPMLLAALTKRYFPRIHNRIVAVHDLSFYLWGLSLSVVTGMTVKQVAHASAPLWILLLIAASALLATLSQFAAGRAIGRHYGARLDAGQAVGQKNTAFAIWIAYTYLSPLSSVGPGFYILWQNLINSWEIKKASGRGLK